MAEFFSMGGYGFFVWPAYGCSVLVLGGVAAVIMRRRSHLRAKLAKMTASQNVGEPNGQ